MPVSWSDGDDRAAQSRRMVPAPEQPVLAMLDSLEGALDRAAAEVARERAALGRLLRQTAALPGAGSLSALGPGASAEELAGLLLGLPGGLVDFLLGLDGAGPAATSPAVDVAVPGAAAAPGAAVITTITGAPGPGPAPGVHLFGREIERLWRARQAATAMAAGSPPGRRPPGQEVQPAGPGLPACLEPLAACFEALAGGAPAAAALVRAMTYIHAVWIVDRESGEPVYSQILRPLPPAPASPTGPALKQLAACTTAEALSRTLLGQAAAQWAPPGAPVPTCTPTLYGPVVGISALLVPGSEWVFAVLPLYASPAEADSYHSLAHPEISVAHGFLRSLRSYVTLCFSRDKSAASSFGTHQERLSLWLRTTLPRALPFGRLIGSSALGLAFNRFALPPQSPDAEWDLTIVIRERVCGHLYASPHRPDEHAIRGAIYVRFSPGSQSRPAGLAAPRPPPCEVTLILRNVAYLRDALYSRCVTAADEGTRSRPAGLAAPRPPPCEVTLILRNVAYLRDALYSRCVTAADEGTSAAGGGDSRPGAGAGAGAASRTIVFSVSGDAGSGTALAEEDTTRDDWTRLSHYHVQLPAQLPALPILGFYQMSIGRAHVAEEDTTRDDWTRLSHYHVQLPAQLPALPILGFYQMSRAGPTAVRFMAQIKFNSKALQGLSGARLHSCRVLIPVIGNTPIARVDCIPSHGSVVLSPAPGGASMLVWNLTHPFPLEPGVSGRPQAGEAALQGSIHFAPSLSLLSRSAPDGAAPVASAMATAEPGSDSAPAFGLGDFFIVRFVVASAAMSRVELGEASVRPLAPGAPAMKTRILFSREVVSDDNEDAALDGDVQPVLNPEAQPVQRAEFRVWNSVEPLQPSGATGITPHLLPSMRALLLENTKEAVAGAAGAGGRAPAPGSGPSPSADNPVAVPAGLPGPAASTEASEDESWDDAGAEWPGVAQD
ncbi:hypothetical protein H696_02682 [Fonticula alba]|uniref:Uncharacterized protein n=1 Tax=Fonticula alba TaxID=691883 RepID=A0A058Z7U7_FONAL|nr:hypothetical protein H696_02682 [Fonticula alba]KCV70355.1 hypothetical protein H696_02682 [Fonticula alba]|eukprot:XP_009494871.1 hypothetical protein H696_02682 [Fonticula alba]